MKPVRNLFAAFVMIGALAACTTLSDQDRALVTAASQNAQAAQQTAQQALQAAQAAQANAASAAADARAAKEEADRIYSRSLRK